MATSKRKILTRLQEKILNYLFRKDFPFFLTGGTALSAFYLYHRYSYDLDLFTTEEEALQRVAPILQSMSKDLDIKMTAIQTEPLFRRFSFEDGKERIIADFVKDINYQVEKKKPVFNNIKVDTLDDIACNKICAILGRKEMKDYIDLYYIAKEGHDIDRYIVLAKNKDAGLNKATLSYVIKDFYIPKNPPYMIEKLDLAEIRKFYRELSEKWAKESFPV